jgi:LacI family transcriptional regulator
MSRPTIRDLAQAAGVSVATVNRVIAGTGQVRPATAQQVLQAAQTIGFHATAVIQQGATATRALHRLGVILQSPHGHFTDALTAALERGASDARDTMDTEVRLRIEQVGDLSPEQVSARMLALADQFDALAVLAAEHPLVTEAIEQLAGRDIPVVAIVSPLSARGGLAYVGLDSWKVGRTAAWGFDHVCREPGRLGILVGTHRYRCHDLYESGFRSYFREHASPYAVLEPLSTFESDAIARELTEKLLRDHADLRGVYVSGGGIQGTLAAVRASGRKDLVVIGHDLLPSTRAGLLDGTLTLVISHPFDRLAQEIVNTTLAARKAGPDAGGRTVQVPFELYTRESL